jgi:hypothetical protein
MKKIFKITFVMICVIVAQACKKDPIYGVYVDKGKVILADKKTKMRGTIVFLPNTNSELVLNYGEVRNNLCARSILTDTLPFKVGVYKINAKYFGTPLSLGSDVLCEVHKTDTASRENTVQILEISHGDRVMKVKFQFDFIRTLNCEAGEMPDSFRASCEEFEMTF